MDPALGEFPQQGQVAAHQDDQEPDSHQQQGHPEKAQFGDQPTSPALRHKTKAGTDHLLATKVKNSGLRGCAGPKAKQPGELQGAA